MTKRSLTEFSLAALFDELTTRVLQLQEQAEKPGTVASMAALLAEAYEAGRCAGIGVQFADSAQRMRHLLDAATAAMPDTPPPGIDSNDPVAKYWRDGRQHLWQLVENERKQMSTAAEVQNAAAAKRAQQLQQRTHAALAPAAPLRQRAGRWLYTLGVRLAERGAA
jgi:hypothetical protein